jgi:hypothetical protein
MRRLYLLAGLFAAAIGVALVAGRLLNPQAAPREDWVAK